MEHIKENILWEYIEGDLDLESKKPIELHLDRCGACKEHYKTLLALHNTLFEIDDDVSLSLSFSSAVIGKIEKQSKVEKINAFWIKFTKIALIHAIITVVLLPVLMLLYQKFELSISSDYMYKLIVPLFSICIVLWILYGMDVLLRRIAA
jgi:predicted anti-sigma-YlaC factor YlaD